MNVIDVSTKLVVLLRETMMDIIYRTKRLTKWQAILWWEQRRILYNAIMLIAGLMGFFIGYVTIPLIYILIAISFNILYTAGYLGELLLALYSRSTSINKYYSSVFFFGYLAYSVISVLLFTVQPNLAMWPVKLFFNL